MLSLEEYPEMGLLDCMVVLSNYLGTQKKHSVLESVSSLIMLASAWIRDSMHSGE